MSMKSRRRQCRYQPERFPWPESQITAHGQRGFSPAAVLGGTVESPVERMDLLLVELAAEPLVYLRTTCQPGSGVGPSHFLVKAKLLIIVACFEVEARNLFEPRPKRGWYRQ